MHGQNVLAIASVFVGITLFAPVGVAEQSQDNVGLLGSNVQVSEPGGVFNMPYGDFAGAEQKLETPRRSPTPDAELLRLKRAGAATVPAVEVRAATSARAVFNECVTNVTTGSAPSDIHGAAGPTNLVVVTNVDIGVYSKVTCAIVSRVALRTFFGALGIPASESLFDPRALYDRLNNRCLVTAESRNTSNTDQFLYVAASTSRSCTSWRRYRIVLSRVSPFTLFCKVAAGNFYDFPNAGYNLRRLVVTSNNFTSPTGPFANGTILSIDKLALYAGAPMSARCFNTGAIGNLAPAVVGDMNPTMFILSPGSGSGTFLRRLRLDTAAAGVGGDTLLLAANITIAPWTAPPDAVQPNGQRLDTSDGRFQSASKQIGNLLWNVKGVGVGSFARWRLYKLSAAGPTALFTFTPATGACANAEHLFNASIDTNSTQSNALAFVTASRTCPALATIGRAAHLIFRGPNSGTTWSFDTIQTSATNFALSDVGGPSCNNTPPRFSCRWGDYSSTQIDPSITSRAWGFNQLVTASTQRGWNTRGALVGP